MGEPPFLYWTSLLGRLGLSLRDPPDYGGQIVRMSESQVLTQNPHPASSTHQAEQASFTREQIPKRASQFSLKINKRQSS
jgi:hypothetical protein